jgi:GTP cyclohydrolase IA
MDLAALDNKLIEYIRDRFDDKFPNDTQHFDSWLNDYINIAPFAPNGNINDNQSISNEVHFIMRTATQYHLTEAFKAMRVDVSDDNVAEDLSAGNIGTPGRIAKTWVGSHIDDDTELGSGRWAHKPRLATFPNNNKVHTPITKVVDVVSNCSHHFITFSTFANPSSYAVISYIPNEFVLGISKLQRLTNWISQRFFLQEDLTQMLYDEIRIAAQTESVYVGLFKLKHGCEVFRGSKSSDGSFTSEYFGGAFNDIQLRSTVTT